MESVNQYIKHQYGNKDVIFSEPLFSHSAVVGATSVLNQKYNAMGAVAILILAMNLNVPAPGAVFTITDNFNRVVFTATLNPALSGQYLMPYLIKGSELRFVCSSNTVQFSLLHQYINITDTVQNLNKP